MMKPAGSPAGYVCVFFVVGSVSVTSDECSARTCVILTSGPSGVTVPLLPKRMPCSALTQPRSIIVWVRPAGPDTLAPGGGGPPVPPGPTDGPPGGATPCSRPSAPAPTGSGPAG